MERRNPCLFWSLSVVRFFLSVSSNPHHQQGNFVNTTLFVIAKITANPGHARQVRAAIELIIAPTRAEAGCISYLGLCDNSNDHCFVVEEQWQSKDAHNAHMLTEHFKALVASIGSLAAIEISELSALA
jgi:quinol monooxygenase YgiN